MQAVILPMDLKEISHEFRNSLAGILGNLHFLSTEIMTPEQTAYINDIKASSERLLKTASLILEKSQLITSNNCKELPINEVQG